jgi:hypothetical protein
MVIGRELRGASCEVQLLSPRIYADGADFFLTKTIPIRFSFQQILGDPLAILWQPSSGPLADALERLLELRTGG